MQFEHWLKEWSSRDHDHIQISTDHGKSIRHFLWSFFFYFVRSRMISRDQINKWSDEFDPIFCHENSTSITSERINHRQKLEDEINQKCSQLAFDHTNRVVFHRAIFLRDACFPKLLAIIVRPFVALEKKRSMHEVILGELPSRLRRTKQSLYDIVNAKTTQYSFHEIQRIVHQYNLRIIGPCPLRDIPRADH